MKIIPIASVLVMFLAGCAPHEPTQMEVTANSDVERSVGECQKSLAEIARAEANIIMAVPNEKRDTVALFYLLNKNNVDIVAAATGHNVNPCKQTNMFDSQIAEMKEKTKQIHEGTGVLSTGVKWIAGSLTVTALADKIGGDSITSYSASDNASITTDSYKSGTDNIQTAGGDATINAGQVGDTTTNEAIDEGSAGIDAISCTSDGDCPSGQTCNQGFCTDGASTQPVFDLQECLTNPPGGIIGGTPMYSSNPYCSCGSHASGGC